MTVDSHPHPTPSIPPDPSPAEYQRLAREILASERGELEPLAVGMLASFTTDFLRPVLTVEGARSGFDVDLFLGDFGQLEQPVIDGASRLYREPRDLLILVFQPGDISPEVFHRYHQTDGSALSALCGELVDRLLATARLYREKTGRPVLVANFATPPMLPMGPFDAADPKGITHQVAAQNARLAQRVKEEPGVYVWDYAGLVRENGSANWSDERLRMLARVAVASHAQPTMAHHLLRTISGIVRPRAKCLVLDLDNTLWGGVVGDDGLEGLQLGDDWPGNPYKAFQQTVLGLRDRGILLAIASKNDEDMAARVFREHPEMLIRWEDLAAVRINWNPKSGNLRSIAEELNIAIDALVFFDDNPVERAEVRAAVPEVRVVEVPSDPTQFTRVLLDSGFFDQPSLSPEDRGRAEMYRIERARSALRDQAPSLEAFLQSLDMVAEVGVAGDETLGRIAQLVAKTNQFNLTTRRHSSAELTRMANSDDGVVAWLRLRDRFGDQGLIAVGILKRRGEDAEIDTLLMSCRVMNRGVERAMVAYLVEHAERMGCTRLVGEYRPTAKNHMVEDLFARLGFGAHGSRDGGTLWSMEVATASDTWPSHITRAETGGNQSEGQ